jgi:hypothetical protein
VILEVAPSNMVLSVDAVEFDAEMAGCFTPTLYLNVCTALVVSIYLSICALPGVGIDVLLCLHICSDGARLFALTSQLAPSFTTILSIPEMTGSSIHTCEALNGYNIPSVTCHPLIL